MTDTISSLPTLKPFLQDVWKQSNFTNTTAIQQTAIPLILKGKDVIAKSPTGTGKTLAYLLPLLEKIDEKNQNVQAVILASSHELVMQIFEETQKWTAGSQLKCASFIGGANLKRQVEKLKKRPQIVVGTPGRIHELIKMKKLKMHEVKLIVLDEGDQLLVPEHRNTVSDIIKASLADRQLVLFSATLSKEAELDAKKLMNAPEVIRIEKSDTTAKVDHLYIICEDRDKIEILRKLGRMDEMKGIAFVRDIGNLNVLAEKLKYKGLPIGAIHSDSNKQERAQAIKLFRDGTYSLLLATDVAARGLDITGITHVIHYDIPKDIDQYTHRSGRTGRIGSTSGTVISLINGRDERKIKQLTKQMDVSVQQVDISKGRLVHA